MKPAVKYLLIIIGIIVFAFLNLAAFNFGKGSLAKKFSQMIQSRLQNRPTPALPVPTPGPKPLRVQGKSTFSISGEITGKPNFSSGFVDPIDSAVGQTQTIGICVTPSDSPIAKVGIIMVTDNKKTPVSFSKKDQQNKTECWEGSWTVNDSYLHTYNTIFEVSDTAGNKNTFEAIWK